MDDKMFQELLESVKQGGAILKGESAPSRSFVMDDVDVKHIRERFALSQAQFSAMLGISIGTLRNWEQGRRHPEGAARVLLQVAARHPEAIWDVVRPEGVRYVASPTAHFVKDGE